MSIVPPYINIAPGWKTTKRQGVTLACIACGQNIEDDVVAYTHKAGMIHEFGKDTLHMHTCHFGDGTDWKKYTMKTANDPINPPHYQGDYDVEPPIRNGKVVTCRLCKREGWALDEFTSPYTGLCAECTNKMKSDDRRSGNPDLRHNHIHPPYYQGDYVMRIIEDFSLDFLDGQVIKYVLRGGHKLNIPELEDLEKALWYLQRKITNLKKESVK